MTDVSRVTRSIAEYFQPRQLVVFGLGMGQGAPFGLIVGTLSFWLANLEISKSTIGLFALASLPYTLKFLWSPVLDRVRLGWLTQRIGLRRAWLLVIQLALIAAIIWLGSSDPANAVGTAFFAAITVGFLSASHDTVLDAYRIEILEDDEQGVGAAMVQFGFRVAALITGAGALFLAKRIGYPETYALMAFVISPALIAAMLWGEPENRETDEARRIRERVEELLSKYGAPSRWKVIATWFHSAVVAPFQEFMTRRGWWLILIFILLFKFGDAIAANQTSPFLYDLGFDEDEVAAANKLVGFVGLMIGIAAGGSLYLWLGPFRSLVVTGVLMMLTNLMFVWLAYAGHDILMLAVTIGFENFATGLGEPPSWLSFRACATNHSRRRNTPCCLR